MLLRVSGSHLQALVIAALETCCRDGELLGLQWADVSLGRGEIVLRAERTKDRETRVVPISRRLRAILEMRRTDPDGRPLPPSAHVFGDDVGRPGREREATLADCRPEGSRAHAGLGLDEEKGRQ